MRAVIVDDETHNIENLRNILHKHFPNVAVAGYADNKMAAISVVSALQPDLVFLDIQMDDTTGFEILQAIPERSFEVIFITAYDQYGIQAIKYAALDYILKPINIAELSGALDKAAKKILLNKKNLQLDFLLDHIQGNRKPVKIALPLLQEVRYVAVEDIIRCEAQNSYTYFFTSGEETTLVSRPLKEYEELLSPHGFIRCHQTHLINPEYVKSYLKEDGGYLLLQNGTKIPVSKIRKEVVKGALAK
ncbi:LytR/AlgR family response regulator transcription factor [Niabella hibiscisoli]|uniref:LytR/AlgR family response regulator transcription factor n=1 Tax=Niabella hibiscisoli TaxID=1825928 RepID=UPI001F0EA794|nr:LytTR family DNA-binding domain-containing protein [Niabella hibiscisoli]MCH5717893.1 LytTR family DNA-binding domain-containing protein [Niabella hibiscisoli]